MGYGAFKGMVKDRAVIFFYIIFVSVVSCCTKNNQTEISRAPVISFAEFEDITENQPQKFIHAPDSFLNTIQLKPKTAEEKEIYAYGLVYMAYGLREHGNIFKSIQYYERALNYTRNNKVSNMDVALYILKPLAALYINVDDTKKAISLLEEILASIPSSELNTNSGYVNNLANAYIYNGEYQRAINLLYSTLSGIKSSVHKALLYNTLSKAYELDQNTAKSKEANQLAIDEFEKYPLTNDTLIWYCSALTQYGEVQQDTHAVQKAISILNTHFSDTEFRNKASAHLCLADILFNQNNIQASHHNYQRAYQYFQKGNSKYMLDYKYTYTLLGMARCFTKLGQLDSAINYYEWTIENDFRTQQLITSPQDQIRNNIWNNNILEELIQLYNEYPGGQHPAALQTILWCIELSKARLLINEINRSENWANSSPEVEKSIQQIRLLYQKYDASTSKTEKENINEQITRLKSQFQLSERYFETINFNPSKKEFFHKIKDKRNTFYSYHIHQDSSVSVMYAHEKELTYHKINTKNLLDSLEKFKLTYFSDSPNAFNNNPEHYIQSAKAFCELLLPNLTSEHKDIFISLDGNLYGLPFDALYKKNFLIYEHNFAYLNSFLLFDFITTKGETKAKDISLLYRAEFPNPLPTLDFVKQEVENLTSKFHTLVIAPQQQNDSTIRNAFSRTNIIHIAAHTILDSSEAPYLFLHQPVSTNQLRFYDINTPLVFLSACNTGSGKPLPSEGTASIQRVFMSKNVPSVISTYWFANDEAMLTLTRNFYDKLEKIQHPVIALAEAKRDFLLHASPQHQNPWYWANINYTGIGNEVGLKKSPNLLIVICIAFVVVIAYFIRKYYLGRIKC